MEQMRRIRLLLFFAMVIITSGVITSCTNTSQVPKSLRHLQEEHPETDTSGLYDAGNQEYQSSAGIESISDGLEEELQHNAQELEESYKTLTNEALSLYMRAQSAFFDRNYELARQKNQRALDTFETADFYALMGSIYYRMELFDEAESHWKQAVSMDPNVVGSMYPDMKNWADQQE